MDLLIDEIFRRYDVLRFNNEKLQQSRIEEINGKIPAFKDLNKEISDKRNEMFRNAGTPEYNYQKVQKQIEDLIGQKRVLLKENGYGEEYLDPIYHCALCRDTGIDEKSKNRCTCFKLALQNERYKELKLDKDNASFENFDLSLFSDSEVIFSGITQKENMSSIFDACLKFASKFPETKKDNLFFFGASGLGKTYLLKCIAKKVIARGYFCLYISSYRLFEDFKKHFLGEIEDIQDFYSTPLLIIDDLGSEPLMKNVTSESFYTLINERLNNRLHTILATNYSLTEIKERYGERIFSRLISVDHTDVRAFCGKDLRLIEKK